MDLDGKEQRSFSVKTLVIVAAIAISATLLIGAAVFLIVKLSNENALLRSEQAVAASESEPAAIEAEDKRIKDNKLAFFKLAFEHCNPPENPQYDTQNHWGTVSLVDGGKTIRLDGDKPNDYGLTINSCLLEKLRAPQSVVAKYDGTKAIDGVRSDSWDDIAAEWTYSPLDGLSAVYEFNLN